MNSRPMLFVEMTDCKYPTKITFSKLAGIHGKIKETGLSCLFCTQLEIRRNQT